MYVTDSVFDTRGFQDWYDQYSTTFYLIGAKYGYERQEVCDVIHQLFLELMEKKIDPSLILNPKSYLSVAFKRKLIDQFRQKGNRRYVDFNEKHELMEESSVQDAIEVLENKKELIDRLNRAYEKLPPRCQRVIKLKFYDGLSNDEIAASTGLSKRTIYNSLFEGVKVLRKEMVGGRNESNLKNQTFLILLLIFLQNT